MQERLLRHALTLVKPDGIVVFSNCSLDRSEGEDMVVRLVGEGLCEHVPAKASDWPGLEEAITEKGEFRTTPAMIAPEGQFAGGLDGFYAARLVKS